MDERKIVFEVAENSSLLDLWWYVPSAKKWTGVDYPGALDLKLDATAVRCILEHRAMGWDIELSSEGREGNNPPLRSVAVNPCQFSAGVTYNQEELAEWGFAALLKPELKSASMLGEILTEVSPVHLYCRRNPGAGEAFYEHVRGVMIVRARQLGRTEMLSATWDAIIGLRHPSDLKRARPPFNPSASWYVLRTTRTTTTERSCGKSNLLLA